MARRKLKQRTTYWVASFDECGDPVEDYEIADRDEAFGDFELLPLEGDAVGAKIEKVTEYWYAGGDGIERREYETLATRGEVEDVEVA